MVVPVYHSPPSLSPHNYCIVASEQPKLFFSRTDFHIDIHVHCHSHILLPQRLPAAANAHRSRHFVGNQFLLSLSVKYCFVMRKLFIGRLSRRTRSGDVEEVFERYGRLSRCDVKYGVYFNFGSMATQLMHTHHHSHHLELNEFEMA